MIKKAATAEIVRVANGWIVYPGGRYSASRDAIRDISETYVFVTWAECEAFLSRLTEEAHL